VQARPGTFVHGIPAILTGFAPWFRAARLLLADRANPPMPPVTILIVDDDQETLGLLSANARSREYEPVTATDVTSAIAAVRSSAIDVALVDLSLGSESGLEAIRHLRALSLDLEIVALSGSVSLLSAIESYDLASFALVQKPVDVEHLFGTIKRAVERRRMNQANRRLIWEMQVINAIGEDLRRSLDSRELLESTLRRLMDVLQATSGGARLMNSLTGEFDMHVAIGQPEVGGAGPASARPSDLVLSTRQPPVLFADLDEGTSPEVTAHSSIRSALSVPMFAGDELIGALSLGAGDRNRFSADDQRLVTTIAGHLAVAIQNARLHSYARTGKQQWEATFDALSDLIAVFDGGGRLLRGNVALATHLGRPVTALGNVSCDEVGLCDGTHPHCAVGNAAAQGGLQSEVTTPTGQIFSVTTCPVPDIADGAVVQIAKNVTQEIQSARRLQQMSDEIAITNERLLATVDRLKTTQAQLLQAEKLSAIGQLVAGVAHELNNPLTSVIGYAQLVEGELRQAPADEPPRSATELASDLRRIAEESERAARIVRNLLAFARRQTAERAAQDLTDLVSRVLALRSYEFRLNGIEIETTFEPGLPHVMADGGHLQQALLNLVLNAEQAMRGRATRRLHFGARYVAVAGAVELSLTDTGHGIADDNLRRIFDPFFTTREVGEGTGLGLSICYGIVRDHGGQITVQSRVGVGTTFSLLLPARADGAVGADHQVLVAHGDQTERDYLAAVLGGWGHRVSLADSAEAARERLRAGGIETAFVDRAFVAADRDGWRSARLTDGERASVVLLTSAEEDASVAIEGAEEASAVLPPPYELRALRAALRAVSKECV
jgi:two-component system NtrC family sensor kinase